MDKPESVSRRYFIKTTGTVAGLSLVGVPAMASGAAQSGGARKLQIDRVASNFEREPLIRPFGFKGGVLTNIWQVAVLMQGGGEYSIGLGTQNTLWSDKIAYNNFSEPGGNAAMYAITDYALQQVAGNSYENPIAMLNEIYPAVYQYGKEVTGNPKLRKNFVYNALVGVDHAAWLLYARQNGISDYDDLIPEQYRPALSYQHEKVGLIPMVQYGTPMDEVRGIADSGQFLMQIKIGQAGTQEEMLEKDKERFTAIHKAIGDRRTPYTEDGRLPYYFDANQRYETREMLLRFLEHTKEIGAYDQVLAIEEPCPEEKMIDLSDLEIGIAADGSATTVEDAEERMSLGYDIMSLKPIAKTLSNTMQIAQMAHERGVPSFCTDLTVNPILVEWNKVFAARLAPLPGLDIGLVETNGHQNYANWEEMRSYHPCTDAPWTKAKDGVFTLREDFYQRDGCIFEMSPHYRKMFARQLKG